MTCSPSAPRCSQRGSGLESVTGRPARGRNVDSNFHLREWLASRGESLAADALVDLADRLVALCTETRPAGIASSEQRVYRPTASGLQRF